MCSPLGVFEGRGQVGAGKRKGSDQSEQAPLRLIKVANVERQSGVRGVSWNERAAYWDVQPYRADGTGRYRKKCTRHQYKTAHLTIEEAIEAARAAAVAHLEELVRRGVIKET